MILVTGGAGYIGSHFVKYLIENGKDVLVIDNLSRGHREAVHEKAKFEKVDILDYEKLLSVLKKYNINSVVHFAAFAYVGESVEHPEMYYSNNVVGSFNLIKAVKECGIKKFVFSSTCSLYGNPYKVPISEDEPTKPINPYAQTKLIIEQILHDYDHAYGLKYVALRYFNAAGADPEGKIGESHMPEPHLIPIVFEIALGKREKVDIFGDNYETLDGTCIRDYIHVNDLADAHLKALEYLDYYKQSEVFNLGTGSGYSVKEIIKTSEKVTGKYFKSEIVNRRAGDPAILVADNKKAKNLLKWVPKYNLEEIITSAWNWHKNPKF
jgi:UDP-glucose 4-epimerase